MLTFNLNDFKGGWVIGDFQPSLMMTRDAEVAIKRYKAGDSEPTHVHRVADEITIVVEGTISINEQVFEKDTIVFIPANESAAFRAITDATTCVIKSPSIVGDKYIV